MQCENIFCIYYAERQCILDEISLNIQGVCENCIYIEINEKVLADYRKELIEKLNEE